jgi:uncharacterized protein (TIGR02266 family)
MKRAKDEAELAARIIEKGTQPAHVGIRESTGVSGAPGPHAPPERRLRPRYAVGLRITLVGDHNFYLGLSENLSEGGLFVHTQNALPIGTTIRLEFTLPMADDVHTVVGEVRWVRLANAVREDHNNYGAGATAAPQPGMGVQFRELSDATAAAIKKFITIRDPEFYAE